MSLVASKALFLKEIESEKGDTPLVNWAETTTGINVTTTDIDTTNTASESSLSEGKMVDLVDYYDEMIASEEAHIRARWTDKRIDGKEFVKNWTIAGVDYKKLEQTFRLDHSW